MSIKMCKDEMQHHKNNRKNHKNSNKYKSAKYWLNGKGLLLGLLMVMITGLFSGCASGGAAQNTDEDGKIQVVCTTFSIYDWTRQIVGENEKVEIT